MRINENENDMSYQIVKNLRADGGQVRCMMCSNNVRPHTYYEWCQPDTPETRQMVRRFLLGNVWQPTPRNTRFIASLGLRYNPETWSYVEV